MKPDPDPDLIAIASARATATGRAEAQWLAALEPGGELAPGPLSKLANGCSQPADLVTLLQLLSDRDGGADGGAARDGDGGPGAPGLTAATDALAASVDASAFDLDEWVAALLAFARHPAIAPQPSPVGAFRALGYLSCCAEAAAGRGFRQPLADVTQEMLDAYGFDPGGEHR